MIAEPEGERVGRLLELAVDDLALIDRLRLVFSPGLNVLTGETGAGKSLLIDALGLALGARADATLVRHGADGARVEALFDRLPEPLIAVREVGANGRSTARLDDDAVTAGRLAVATSGLVEIHGQHDQQRLLDEGWQRDLLDAYGGHGDLRAIVASAVERWRANRAAQSELEMDPRELIRRLDLLEHEATEIAAAGLRPGEAEEITGQLAIVQHGETIMAGAADVRETLLGEGGGAREQVAKAEQELRSLARLDARWGPLADRLAGLEAELEDVAAEARTLTEGVDHDPASLERLEERLGEIHRLLRRYGDDEAAVIDHGVRSAAEAERLRGLEDERARRAADDARLLLEVADASASLSIRRAATATELGASVGRVLAELGFPAEAFGVALGRRPAARDDPAVEVDGDAVAFDATGIDTVVLTFRPNAGEPAASAGPDRVGWRAVARRAGRQAGARGGRRHADARVRRDRHRHRWTERRPGRAQPVGAGPRPPGPVRDPPAADRRLRGRPLPDREARARRPDRDRRRAPRARRARGRARPDDRGPGRRPGRAAVGARAAGPRGGVAGWAARGRAGLSAMPRRATIGT